MTPLEQKRQLLEELDGIEKALTERIAKSDNFLPPQLQHNLGKRSYSARENAVRRLDAALLVDKYEQLRRNWNTISDLGPDLDSELNEASKISDDVGAVLLMDKYGSLETRGLGRFVSKYTHEALDEVKNYPSQEHFGTYLWLEPFYAALPADKRPDSYRSYLVALSESSDLARSDPKLMTYLVEFYNRYFSVGKYSKTTAAEVAPAHIIPIKPASDKASNELYCSLCKKNFTNENVYKAHLSGKKHLRAEKESSGSHIGSQMSVAARDDDNAVDIDEILNQLKPVLNTSIANLDRKIALTDEERQLEVDALYKEREKEDDALSDCDEFHQHEDRSIHPKQLKGPQGTPIPRWLYKLHGLGKVFICEICGFDVRYSGRKAFDRHFTSKDNCHVNGLRQLGIEPSPAFSGISSISEAQELQKALNEKKQRGEKEVEDDEGNVMGERMYEDLKRQGLI